MTKDFVRFVHNYGPLRRGHEYCVLRHGYDYVVVKHGGGAINVPQNLIAPDDYRFQELENKYREEIEEEDYQFYDESW